jgi:hypothetical protein
MLSVGSALRLYNEEARPAESELREFETTVKDD